MSNLELQPDGVANENMKKTKTRESTAGHELVTKQETLVKLVDNNPDITYENTKIEGQNKIEPKNQSKQSQYEELNTENDRKDEHVYCEVSLR